MPEHQQGKMKLQPLESGGFIEIDEFMNLVHPVHQRIAVDVQGCRCLYHVTLVCQIHIQCVDVCSIVQNIISF